MSVGHLIVGWNAANGALSSLGGEVTPQKMREVLSANPYALLSEVTVPGTLFAFSLELTLKALSIRSDPDASCLQTHELIELWSSLKIEDRRGITTEVAKLGKDFDLDDIEDVLREHSSAFTQWRYFLQKSSTGSKDIGSLNTGALARVAIGAIVHATNPLHGRFGE